MRHISLKWALALVLAPILSSCVPLGDAVESVVPVASVYPTATTPTESPSAVVTDLPPLPSAPSATSTPSSPPTPVSQLPQGCEVPEGLSQPEQLQAGDVDPRKVVRLPRDSSGASPVPPDFAKDIYAWDNQGGELGEDEYKAYFTAHTYSSDQGALGNVLQKSLHSGDLIRVTNTEGRVICYEVSERIEVLESEYVKLISSRPSKGVLTIMVCSGLEGKVWTKRTVWFANLVTE